MAVAAFVTNKGCILAASIEAKRIGIKTGMRVFEGRKICPSLVVLPPDPWKYRDVHLKLRRLISDYTNDFAAKSIDELKSRLDSILNRRTMSSVSGQSQTGGIS